MREMLDALVWDGALSTGASIREASGKAQVRPKSNEKCAFILNGVKQNAFDSRKPRRFQLPQIEYVRDYVLLGGGGATEPIYGKTGFVQLFLECAHANELGR